MELTLARFVTALRKADVRVSPAETLDALAVARQVGLTDSGLLRDALALALAKTATEKRRFDACFERFFHQLAFGQAAKSSMLRNADPARFRDALGPALEDDALALIEAVLRDDRTALAARVQAAAPAAGINDMAQLRDKAVVAADIGAALGLPQLEQAIRTELPALSATDRHALRYVRSYLADEIRNYVNVQYQLRVDATGKRALIEAALHANLNQIPPAYHDAVKASVRALAARLRNGRRRRRRGRRGALDLKRTLRRNLGYGEALFQLEWRRRHRQEATVFILCDVSGSVAAIARFLLLLVYELADVLPRVRTFAFSNRLGEITSIQRAKGRDVAIETALFDWGKGTTDYGRAWLDFRTLVGKALGHRSTIIVLGDARNNFFDPGVDRFRSLAHRAGRVIWFNPEGEDRWQEGDSEMRRFLPHCTRVWRLSSLADLERIAGALVNETI
jgi:uncharacterized protein with von Willebrand factor type A (vWA) domain